MEVKVNREIREYTEGVFFGMSLRQCVFALLACVAAVGLYFGLSPFLRLDELSWACIAGAAPVRRAGVRHLARLADRTRGVGVGQIRAFDPQGTARAPAEPVLRGRLHAASREGHPPRERRASWPHSQLGGAKAARGSSRRKPPRTPCPCAASGPTACASPTTASTRRPGA